MKNYGLLGKAVVLAAVACVGVMGAEWISFRIHSVDEDVDDRINAR